MQTSTSGRITFSTVLEVIEDGNDYIDSYSLFCPLNAFYLFYADSILEEGNSTSVI